MKIVFVMGLPVPYPGAAWTRIEIFVKLFMSKGHQVLVIGTEKRENSPYLLGTSFRGRGPLNIAAFFIVTLKAIFKYHPDVVIISVPPGIHGLGASLACLVSGRRLVFDYRDEWEDYLISKASSRIRKVLYRLLKNIMTILYSKALFVSTVTHPFMNSLSRRGVSNIHLIPNGADTNVFKPSVEKRAERAVYGFEVDDFILIYSGYIGKYYRLNICIEAMSILSKRIKNIKLVLIGEGEDLEKVLKLSKELEVDKNVVYMGVKYDKTELSKIIAIADAGLIPYDGNKLWKNSLPAKFFEYCACGLPVIATVYSDSILAEIIERNQVGIIVEPENAMKLTEAILSLVSHRDFLAEASVRARELIEREFDRLKMAERLMEMIEKSVGSN